MKITQKQLVDKKDTKKFIKESNVSFWRYIFYASKNIFNPKQFRRYIKKAKSIHHNKKINKYPSGFIESKKRVAVYTALYGDYDQIKRIKHKNPRCDYYIFTDQAIPTDCDWKLRNYEFDNSIKDNPVLENRFLKMHPHLLFPEYDFSIYIDASIAIELDIIRLLSRIGDKYIALFNHHAGVVCSYEEAERVKRIGLENPEIVDKQINRYRSEGFPSNFGFYECGIIVRKHNDYDCISIMNTWWNEFVNESKRDQLSFMYSVWKNNKTTKDIACLGLTFWIEPILSGSSHKDKRKLVEHD